MTTARTKLLLLAAALCAATTPAAADRLLEETVAFTGQIAFLGSGAPGLVIAAVRNGETAFAGFGETARGSGVVPTADTMMRVASISKAFCGDVLASLVAAGEIGLTDPVQDRLPEGFVVPERDGRTLRIIDLATQTSGLPREMAQTGGTPDNPYAGHTREAMAAAMKDDPFLFPPGTGAFYSNLGFDLLGLAIGEAAGKPYAEVLADRVLQPRGMSDTVFNPRPGDEGRLMQGHAPDGSPLPFVPTPPTMECASGLYTTPGDMLKWIAWHLATGDADDARRTIESRELGPSRRSVTRVRPGRRRGSDVRDGARLGRDRRRRRSPDDPAQIRWAAGHVHLRGHRPDPRHRRLRRDQPVQRRGLRADGRPGERASSSSSRPGERVRAFVQPLPSLLEVRPMTPSVRRRLLVSVLMVGYVIAASAPSAFADDPLLEEAVGFTGAIAFLGSGAPGLVIAAVRDGETAFAGFGEISKGSGQEPQPDTLMRIASISKAFCGDLMGSMVADGTIGVADPLADHLGDGWTVPERDGRTLRLIDLVTQASGLPREVPNQTGGTPDDPFAGNTVELSRAELAKADPYLFAPGTGVFYSNWGFDLLGQALANAGGKPYAELLAERVLIPRGLTDTKLNLAEGDAERTMQGHFFDGTPMPLVPSPETIGCAGGLYTSAARHAEVDGLAPRPRRGRRQLAHDRPRRLAVARRPRNGQRHRRRRPDGDDDPRLGRRAARRRQAPDAEQDRRPAGPVQLCRDRALAGHRRLRLDQPVQRRRLRRDGRGCQQSRRRTRPALRRTVARRAAAGSSGNRPNGHA